MPRPKIQPRRVLPAAVYDTLEIGALAFGGIGAGRWYDKRERPFDYPPLCGLGYGHYLGIEGEIRKAGLTEELNDLCVVAVSSKKRARNGRIAFADWCQWLNVHRGP